MPGGKAVAQQAVHDFARQGVKFDLRHDRLDAEVAGQCQQQHDEHDPEDARFQRPGPAL